MKINLKKVMTRAWEIYRGLRGGDRIARLSVAMKLAWAEAKTTAQNPEKVFGGKFGIISESDVEKLIKMGANRWQKAEHDRLYLSNAGAELIRLEIDRYKSGNICWASLNGEKISNASAGRTLYTFSKAYIDLATGKLCGVANGDYKELFIEKVSEYINVA